MNSFVDKCHKRISPLFSNCTLYLIMGVSAALRLLWLGSDPPWNLAKGQSLWTDPSQYVFFARNLVLFGKMDLFQPSSLVFFKYSLISFLSIPIFFIIGVGFEQSNLVASVISFAAIAIFSYMIKKTLGDIAGVLTFLFSGTAYIFVMHNRLPYLENASLFLLVLSYYFYFVKEESKMALFLAGSFFIASILIGKVLAVHCIIAYIGVFVMDYLLEYRTIRQVVRRLGIFLLGFVSFGVILSALFYLPSYMDSRKYLEENIIHYYGFPDGMKSLTSFIKCLYTLDIVNFENGFFSRMPVISILAALSLSFMIFEKWPERERRLIIFLGLSFWCGFIFLAPWNYRPIRYELYLVLPIAALASLMLRELLKVNYKGSYFNIAVGTLVLSFVIFHLHFHISGNKGLPSSKFWEVLRTSFILSAMFSFALYFILKLIKRVQLRFRLSLVGILVLLFLMFEINNYLEWGKGITYSIYYVNRNLANELGSDAVVIGPYAQTITLGNHFRSEIYYFGAYPENDRLFDTIPATHVVFESGSGSTLSGNEKSFNKYYPHIRAKAILIDSYLVGRYYINVYNICGGTNNTLARSYRMSNFETAMTFYHEGEIDSALAFFEHALEFDQARRALLYMAEIHLELGDIRRAKEELEKGLMDDCYDPRFWAMYSVTCSKTGDLVTSQYARKKAATYAHSEGYFKDSKP